MPRVVSPEWLDSLPANDPRAIASRADLRRINRIMGHVRWLDRELQPAIRQIAHDRNQSVRVIELGGGDGTLLLQLLRRWTAAGLRGTAVLLDMQPAVSTSTHEEFIRLGWSLEIVTADVLEGLNRFNSPSDIMLANLFLHHFPALAARLLGLIGCNDVTRHDAVVSVRAGFNGTELSTLWPADSRWLLRERPMGLFSHGFIATKVSS
jgi:hypothetical protein